MVIDSTPLPISAIKATSADDDENAVELPIQQIDENIYKIEVSKSDSSKITVVVMAVDS